MLVLSVERKATKYVAANQIESQNTPQLTTSPEAPNEEF
jgi:hypothetical protein